MPFKKIALILIGSAVATTVITTVAVGTYVKYIAPPDFSSQVVSDFCSSELGKYLEKNLPLGYFMACHKHEFRLMSCYLRLGTYAVLARSNKAIEGLNVMASKNDLTDAQMDYYCPDSPTQSPPAQLPPINPNLPSPCKDNPLVTDASCNLPPSNLAVKFITADSGSDAAGTIKLTWQNNGDYSDIEVERAKEKDYTDWTNINSLSGIDEKYSDDLGTIQLPEDKEGYRVRAVYPDGTHSGYSNVAELNNCVDMLDNPAMNSIVFRREDNLAYNVKTLLKQVNSTVGNYFAQVDPYKSYFSTFEFHFDLKQLKHSDLSYSGNKVSFDSGPMVKSTSSCKNNTRAFVSLLDNPGLYYAWTDVTSGPASYIYMNVGSNYTSENGTEYANTTVRSFSNTILHEMGHALAILNDEYTQSGDWLSSITSGYDRENCAINPSSAFTSSVDGLMYGAPASNSTLGCGVATSSLIGIYRSTPLSIMSDNLGSNSASTKFNVISCGYLVAGILLDPIDKTHAEKYWPACMKMDTVKDGIPTSTLQKYQ